MKLNRSEFKSLLKECILELIQEGKLSGLGPQPQQQPPTQSVLGETPTGEVNPRLEDAVKLTARLIARGDAQTTSMYESLVADTARHTLQKQLSHQMTGGGGLASGDFTTPEEKRFDQEQLGLFQASNRWATLAFGRKKSADS